MNVLFAVLVELPRAGTSSHWPAPRVSMARAVRPGKEVLIQISWRGTADNVNVRSIWVSIDGYGQARIGISHKVMGVTP